MALIGPTVLTPGEFLHGDQLGDLIGMATISPHQETINGPHQLFRKECFFFICGKWRFHVLTPGQTTKNQLVQCNKHTVPSRRYCSTVIQFGCSLSRVSKRKGTTSNVVLKTKKGIIVKAASPKAVT